MSVESTSIKLTWISPSDKHTNGKIRLYIINLVHLFDNSAVNYSTNATEIGISGLTPYHLYNLRVAAFTTALGPFSNVTELETSQDGL